MSCIIVGPSMMSDNDNSGGPSTVVINQHLQALTHDNIMTSPPASPGSPPALALVHHPHVPNGAAGGYITPPTIYNVAHPSHMQVVSMSMDPCYSAHLA